MSSFSSRDAAQDVSEYCKVFKQLIGFKTVNLKYIMDNRSVR